MLGMLDLWSILRRHRVFAFSPSRISLRCAAAQGATGVVAVALSRFLWSHWQPYLWEGENFAESNAMADTFQQVHSCPTTFELVRRHFVLCPKCRWLVQGQPALSLEMLICRCVWGGLAAPPLLVLHGRSPFFALKKKKEEGLHLSSPKGP